MRDVRSELADRLQAAVAAGVDPAFVVLDPGLGFAKEAQHNWRLLGQLDVLQGLGRPLLVGASRKRFLGSLLAGADGTPPPTADRDGATAAVSALASAAGRVVRAGARAGGEPGRRPGRRRVARRRHVSAVPPVFPSDPVDVREVEEVNRALYAAIENGDLDAMGALWAGDDDGDPSVCVHPGWDPVHGRARILRSWALVMAGTPYIQFFLTDVRTRVVGDVAVVSCAENILTAVTSAGGGTADPSEGFAGGQVVATNVFLRTADGWRAVVHHASPVLAGATADADGDDTDGDDTDGDDGGGDRTYGGDGS